MSTAIPFPKSKDCSRCKLHLPAASFNIKDASKGRLHSQCRACTALTSAEFYARNRNEIIAKAAVNKSAQQKLLRAEVKAQLKGQSCSCCGAKRNLTFRLDPGYDGPRVSAAAAQGMSMETLLASIGNSTIICKTCMGRQDSAGLQAYTKAKLAGEEYEGSTLTRAEQKELRTRSGDDRRRNRAKRIEEAEGSAA